MLKRRYATNPQDPEQSLQNEDLNTPPNKLSRKNLYYSKFSKPIQLEMNTYDNTQKSPDITDLQMHLEKLEQNEKGPANPKESDVESPSNDLSV